MSGIGQGTVSQEKPWLGMVVSGLFQAPQDTLSEKQNFPALETLLAHADQAAMKQPDYLYSCLCGLFGLDSDMQSDVPFAALTRAAEGGQIDDGWWLHADPVHLIPDRDQLVLIEGEALGISLEEATTLAREIQMNFEDRGWRMEALTPNHWYLTLPVVPQILTTPLMEVSGKNILGNLPRGRDAVIWHTVMNEVQTLLHASSVNEERENRGLPPVNSLWFWGGGRFPKINGCQWRYIWAVDPIARGLALSANVKIANVPDSGEQWLQELREPGKYLLVMCPAAIIESAIPCDSWSSYLAVLENRWFRPLLQALKRETVAGLSIYSEKAPVFSITAKKLRRRWWRRRRSRSLDHYLTLTR